MDDGFIEEIYDQVADQLRFDRELVSRLWRLYRAGRISEADYRLQAGVVVAGTLEMITGPLRLVKAEGFKIAGHVPGEDA